jgi:ABC-2 type transport system ATP-binding protein
MPLPKALCGGHSNQYSLNIHLQNIGKKYNKDWIFRGINLQLKPNDRYVVLGANGSGKSTFLKLVAGFSIPSEGTMATEGVSADDFYKKVSIAAPYFDVYTDYTLEELVQFHRGLKPFFSGISCADVIDKMDLKHAAHKQLKHYSSGMLQRVKLGLAILSETPLLLLDEPTSNLDKRAVDWYNNLLSTHLQDRIILVASNHQNEDYKICDKQIEIESYKSVLQ